MPNGVYMVDRDRRILLWNDGAEKISGYLRQEVVGQCCRDDLLVHCDESNNSLCGSACPLKETLEDGKPRVADVFLRHKDGQRVPVRVRAVPIRDFDGGIIGAAEVFDERVLLPDADEHAHSRAVHDSVDALTGIPDPESTRRHLDGWLLDFTDSQLAFGLLTIAIDGLEGLRTSRGAKAAEAMVRVVARTLSSNLRPSDLAGCWEQDRFVAILADCPGAALPRIARMLQRILSGAAISWWGDRIPVAVSIGATAVREGDTAESILDRSQEALAASLSAGGNRVTTI